MIEQVAQSANSDLFGIWEDNVESMMMFMRLQTQWHVTPHAFIGLNYQSAEYLIRIHGIADPVSMMDDLQAMELAALQVLNKRKE